MEWDTQFALDILPRLVDGLVVTLQATFMGSVVAYLVGLPLAILRRSRNLWIATPVRLCVEAIRRTPLLMQLYVIFYVLPDVGIKLDALTAGILGMGLHYAAYTSEVYRAGIDRLPKGQWEALKALNAPWYWSWRRVILPQAIPPMIPALGNYLIAMFKESAVLFTITVIELMGAARAIGNESYRYLEPVTLVAIFYLLISVPSTLLLRLLEVRVVR